MTSAILAQRSIKEMTRIMVEQYSEFPSLDAYLSGYAIIGDRLAQLAVPSHILLSLDDPIIPARDLQDVARSPQLQIAAIPHGGHCGFMESFASESWADRQVAKYMGLVIGRVLFRLASMSRMALVSTRRAPRVAARARPSPFAS